MDLLQLSPATLVIVLVSLLLGYLTFSILAGLSGTGCSTMEDVQGASTLSTMLIFVGYFAAVIAGSIGGDVLNLFVSLCPVISVFAGAVCTWKYRLWNPTAFLAASGGSDRSSCRVQRKGVPGASDVSRQQTELPPDVCDGEGTVIRKGAEIR